MITISPQFHRQLLQGTFTRVLRKEQSRLALIQTPERIKKFKRKQRGSIAFLIRKIKQSLA